MRMASKVETSLAEKRSRGVEASSQMESEKIGVFEGGGLEERAFLPG
jgi:hypothetical protein